jgi:ParB family chromosome partitioning protein
MAAFKGDSIFWIETNKIVANPYQPRREFDEEKLKELADSIRMYGILQPLTVSRQEVHGEDGSFRSEYELIAGERRLRASKLAGLEQVPVIIREGEDSEQEKLELAIIENLQREDLNAVDRALAFKQLADVFDLSHNDVAKKVGRSREYVSNSIRLLQLPDYMLDSLKINDIMEGHARTLLMLNDRPEEQDTLYREILLKKLTVREVERIARKIATDKVRKQKWKGTDPELIEKEKQFTETLGTRVQLTKTDYGGKITIDYFSEEDLDVLLSNLAQNKQGVSPVSPVTSAAAAVVAEPVVHEAMDSISAATPLEPSEPAPEEPVVHEPMPSSAEEVPAPQPEPTPEPLTPPEPAAPATPTAEPAVSDVNAAPAPKPAPESAMPPAPEMSPLPDTTTAHSTEPAVPAYQPTTSPTPEPESLSPEPIPTEHNTTYNSPSNSLRAKLADLFTDPNRVEAAAPSESPEPTAAPAPTPAPEVPPTAPSEPTPQPEAEPDKKPSDDDDLYGVKNFSI